MTTFEKVYQAVRLIPEGSVATYGQVAEAIGNRRLSRVVGFALHVNPEPGVIPCHRVVKQDGEVSSAFAFGTILVFSPSVFRVQLTPSMFFLYFSLNPRFVAVFFMTNRSQLSRRNSASNFADIPLSGSSRHWIPFFPLYSPVNVPLSALFRLVAIVPL